ncbi:MAG TPA: efflux RND transporter periplasmic adaptor subunit [Campylobacterales bacterium]|nr:efflux RND transporter periplasmic adaptor subunit [Campylobacterales bacterium]
MRKILLSIFVLSLGLSAGSFRVTGTVISDNQKMIGARYMGYVKRIYFEIGDKVRREDTLFELESAEFDIMKNQADLALEQAEIMVDMYRTRMDSIKRNRARLQRGGSSKFDLEDMDVIADNVSAGLAAAQAMVKSAAEKVKQMATIADYLEVFAPNDGIIVQKNIRVGDLIVPGMLTMVLVDLDHLEIEAQVVESDLLKIRPRQMVDIEIPSLNHKMRGTIKSIVPSANPMAHTFAIRIKFKKDHEMIFPGMFAKIDIEFRDPPKPY